MISPALLSEPVMWLPKKRETSASAKSTVCCAALCRVLWRRFNEGDCVRVRPEDAAIRWRRPHLRTPGYIFGQVTADRNCHLPPTKAAAAHVTPETHR